MSLDYIKSDKRRGDFLRACPEFVIVDEAHTCAGTGQGQQKRYELLRDLARDPARQMVFLTATPHSGDEGAFYRLLGLLDPAFDARCATTTERREPRSSASASRGTSSSGADPTSPSGRRASSFPRRETTELTYKLTGAWDRFFGDVLDYCATVVAAAGGDARRQRLNFWGTLALMRCVASSPAAGVAGPSHPRGRRGPDDDDALGGAGLRRRRRLAPRRRRRAARRHR